MYEITLYAGRSGLVRTIQLPFVPFVGLQIDFDEPYITQVKLTDVVWSNDNQGFYAGSAITGGSLGGVTVGQLLEVGNWSRE